LLFVAIFIYSKINYYNRISSRSCKKYIDFMTNNTSLQKLTRAYILCGKILTKEKKMYEKEGKRQRDRLER